MPLSYVKETMKRYNAIMLVALSILAQTANSQDVSVPNTGGQADGPRLALWELGVGAGGALLPDYPGADNRTGRALPFPVVIYRGSFLRVGDGSVASGRFFQNERLKLDVSLNGSFNAESDEVEARTGMPDLGFIAEVGPELEILLSDPADTQQRLKLEIPVRGAFSIDDGDLTDRGWVFSPQLEYERNFAGGDWEWSVSLTPSFAGRRLQQYFYEVAPQFATAERAAYEADGGYLRTSLGFGVQRRSKRSFAAIGVNLNTLSGAANEDSPLFRRNTEFSVAAVVVFRLWESEKRAPR
ncbi:MAG: MipA/OmpV family protein [Woeseiaceae bacterium]